MQWSDDTLSVPGAEETQMSENTNSPERDEQNLLIFSTYSEKNYSV